MGSVAWALSLGMKEGTCKYEAVAVPRSIMAGILRKFASAFVVLDESQAAGGMRPDLDDITKDAPALLAQLDATGANLEGAAPGQDAMAGGPLVAMNAEQ